jgi:DNA-binding Xre family transcriptional regulator
MALRHRIREVAEAKGITKTMISRRAEIHYKTISELWSNPYRVVKTDILYRIAQVLGVSVHDLLEEVPDQTNS